MFTAESGKIIIDKNSQLMNCALQIDASIIASDVTKQAFVDSEARETHLTVRRLFCHMVVGGCGLLGSHR